MSPIQGLRYPRAFFADLREHPRGLGMPLVLMALTAFLSALSVVLRGERAPEFLLFDTVAGLVFAGLAAGLITLVAWAPTPIRAPEILGYSLAPLAFALVLNAPAQLVAPALAQAVYLAGLVWTALMLFVGLDEIVGRTQALRVVVALPLGALAALGLLTAL